MAGTSFGKAPSFAAVLAALAPWVAAGPLAGQMMDKRVYTFIQAEQLEYAPNGAERPVSLEAQGWIGGDYNRFWAKVEGDAATIRSAGYLEVQALYSRLVAPYWDLQAGVRFDSRFGGQADETRLLMAVGFQGLAPYWFEVEPALFVSQNGDVSARLTASYDLFFTQRLIVQPEMELNAAVQDVEEWGIASGLTDLELGIRMRYEIRREFAPYVGFTWTSLLGGTKDLAASFARETSDGSIVLGVRAWY